MSDPAVRIDADDRRVLHIGSAAVRLPRPIREFQSLAPDFVFAFLERDGGDPPGFELVALGADGTLRWRTPPGRDGSFLPPGWIEAVGDDYVRINADRAFALVALADGAIVVRL